MPTPLVDGHAMRRASTGSPRSQRGVALIVLALLLVLGVTWFLASGLNSITHSAINRSDNAEALAQAKAALIGRMVTDASDSGERNPGGLPCPEAPGYFGTVNEGVAAGNCSAPAIGRLPWRTLGLPKLLDASGEPLWYVVSPGWALPSSTATLRINSDSVGSLTVDGQANAAVALIIAPGGPVITAGTTACSARAQRRDVVPLDVCNFVEAALDLSINPTGTPLPTPSFTTVGATGGFNDQVLRVTAADLVPPLEAALAARAQRDLAPLLADAANGDGSTPVRFAPVPGFYPFAAPWTDSPTAIYAGAIGASQGMLPLVRSRKACDPLTDPACGAVLKSKDCVEGVDEHCASSSAVRWRIGSTISDIEEENNYRQWKVSWNDGSRVTIELASGYGGNGRIGAVDCSGSNETLISCVVSYGRNCSPPPSCSWVWPRITVTADTGTTAGITFRRLNPGILDTRFQGANVSWRTGGNLGAARVAMDWQLPVSAFPCDSLTCSTTTIQIPSLFMEDNIPLQSRLRDAPEPGAPELRWLLANEWQQLIYFAVTGRQIPGGSGSCNPATCVSVAGVDASLASQQAILVLAGRALTGQSHPSLALSNYFERSNLSPPQDTRFEVGTVTKDFNDRIVLISPRP